MKKVLIVANNNLGIGGIQNVIMSIVRELKGRYQFDVIVFQHDDIHYEEEFLQTGKIFTISRPIKTNSFRTRLDYYIRPVKLYRKALKIIRENGPYDVIHCHNYFEAGLFLKAAKKCGIPVRIAHSHNYFEKQSANRYIRKCFDEFYRKLILLSGTDFIACSQLAGKYLYGDYAKMHIIHNAISLETFHLTKTEAVSAWSLLHIGRWSEQKNQEFLLDVFGKIYQTNKEATLSLVGYGTEADKRRLLEKIAELGIGEAVTFYPPDSNIPQIIAEHNVFVFPSIHEGLGIVLIEAQAMGMKCFASTKVPEEADLGLVTFIPLSAGVEYWAQEINQYIKENGTTRHQVSMETYDIKNVAQEYATIYDGGL